MNCGRVSTGLSVKALSFSRQHCRWLTFAILVYGLLLWGNALIGGGSVQVASAVSVYLIVVALVLWAFAGKASLIHPVVFFVLWHELFRGFLPRFAIYFESEFVHRALTYSDSDWVLAKHSLLSAFFVICLFLGHWIGRHVAGVRREVHLFRVPNSKLVLWIFFGVALVAFAYVANAAGGVSELLLQRGQARSDRVLNSMEAGHLVVLVRSLPYVCIAWLAIAHRAWRDPIYISIFAISLLMAFLISGSRGGMLAPLLVAAVVFLAKRPDSKIKIGVVAMYGLILALLFGVATDIRHQTFGEKDVSRIAVEFDVVDKIKKTVSTFSAYAVDGDASFPIIAYVPEEEGYLLGASYLSVPFAPIPGALLPFDKPSAGGALAASVFFGTTQNTIPPKHVGEAFWNFSYLGVAIAALGFGAIMSALYRSLELRSFSPGIFIIYIILIFTFTPTSDAFYSAVRGVGPVVIFLALNRCLLFLKRSA